MIAQGTTRLGGMMEEASSVERRVDAVKRPGRAKRQVIADAALRVFLRRGFAGASIDEIAAEGHVSKPTIYAYFSSKEELFRQIMAAIVEHAQSGLTTFTPAPAQDATDVARELHEYAQIWMRSILQPDLLALRRLVIGEASRFPELALTYYEGGPLHVEQRLAERLGQLAEAGYLAITNPSVAAQHFGYLIVGPLQTRAMFVPGNLPTPAETAEAIESGVSAFLALYSTRDSD
jgi:TetR/AcrR family transcriptional regulator, mexJK operon transcriptional repressor